MRRRERIGSVPGGEEAGRGWPKPTKALLGLAET